MGFPNRSARTTARDGPPSKARGARKIVERARSTAKVDAERPTRARVAASRHGLAQPPRSTQRGHHAPERPAATSARSTGGDVRSLDRDRRGAIVTRTHERNAPRRCIGHERETPGRCVARRPSPQAPCCNHPDIVPPNTARLRSLSPVEKKAPRPVNFPIVPDHRLSIVINHNPSSGTASASNTARPLITPIRRRLE